MDLVFFRCEVCNNTVVMVKNSGNPMRCCGKEMTKLTVEDSYGDAEKHEPVCTISNGLVHVKVSTKPHPMEADHHIMWICVQTREGFQLKQLDQDGPAEADFMISPNDEVEKVYCYCNVHGLWKESVEYD